MTRARIWFAAVASVALLWSSPTRAGESIPAPGEPQPNVKTFAVRGEVRALRPDGRTILIQHGAISNFMDAMTMPFHAKDAAELAGLRVGDWISFRLQVTETESWIDHVARETSAVDLASVASTAAPAAAPAPPARPRPPLLDYHFTNELGQAVSLGEFRGQALAITFFFTRCPMPDYCPRLSKNFQEASQKLAAMPNAPTNWHFLSVTFDPEFDRPAVLKTYAEHYGYDSKHWSFLTGPPDKIGELAQQSQLRYERDGGLFNHDFRTLIVDANGHLQMVFPFGGNISDLIVNEMLKAVAVTNAAASAHPM